MNIKVAGMPYVYHHDHVKVVQKKLDYKPAVKKSDNESTEQLTPVKYEEPLSSQPVLTELQKVAHQISAIQAVELKSRESLLTSRNKSQRLQSEIDRLTDERV